MGQSLQIGTGYVEVDQHFRGAQIRERHQVVDGKVVVTESGQPAPRDIVRVGKGYYYLGNPLTPVHTPEHLAHLPEPHHTAALAFLEAQKERPARPIRPGPVRASKARPKKHKPVVVGRHQGAHPFDKAAEEKNEREFRELTGGVRVEQAAAVIEDEDAKRRGRRTA